MQSSRNLLKQSIGYDDEENSIKLKKTAMENSSLQVTLSQAGSSKTNPNDAKELVREEPMVLDDSRQ